LAAQPLTFARHLWRSVSNGARLRPMWDRPAVQYLIEHLAGFPAAEKHGRCFLHHVVGEHAVEAAVLAAGVMVIVAPKN